MFFNTETPDFTTSFDNHGSPRSLHRLLVLVILSLHYKIVPEVASVKSGADEIFDTMPVEARFLWGYRLFFDSILFLLKQQNARQYKSCPQQLDRQHHFSQEDVGNQSGQHRF